MKKSTKHHHNGYIVVLSLMLTSIIAIIITALFYQASSQIRYDKTMIDRMQAKMLALGGVQLALSQLIGQSNVSTTTKIENNEMIRLFKEIVPSLNRWQEFTLTKVHDGIDGVVKFAISSEQGKVDVNELFNFQEKKFKNEGKANDAKKLFQDLFNGIKKIIGEKDLFGPFEKFLKQRAYKLDDITELLAIPEFQTIFKKKIFYQPPTTEQPKQTIALSDIFTIYSGQEFIQPFLFSDSLCAFLNLTRAQVGDIEKRKKTVADIEKNLKSSAGTLSEQKISEQLQLLYGKNYATLPASLKSYIQDFQPTIFSILSSGKVGNVRQVVLVIVETKTNMQAQNAKQSEQKQSGRPYTIKRLYWL